MECDDKMHIKIIEVGKKSLINKSLTFVDEGDFFTCSKKSWYLGSGYAYTTIDEKNIPMHKFILGEYDGVADHINGNRLDNRRCNLRITDRKGNARNSKLRKDNKTGFKGVHFCTAKKKYKSFIWVDSKPIYLGYFDKPEDAYSAYCAAAIKYHGEYARLR